MPRRNTKCISKTESNRRCSRNSCKNSDRCWQHGGNVNNIIIKLLESEISQTRNKIKRLYPNLSDKKLDTEVKIRINNLKNEWNL